MKSILLKKATILFLVFSFLIGPFNLTPVYAQTAPTLIAPANGSTKTANPGDTPPLAIPEFKWSAVPGATIYRFQISGDSAFTVNIVDITTTNTTFTPQYATNFSDGTWHWRVRVEAPVTSLYSGERTFVKQWATATNTPSLIKPDNGATIDMYKNPIFSWTPVIGAAKYQIQVYTSPNGWSFPVADGIKDTLATSFQPAYKWPNGTYYWRVIPIDQGEHKGTPSQERSFVMNYNFIPELQSPADLSFPTFTPTFRWTAVEGAQGYTLQYSTSSDFNAGTTTVSTANTTFTPTATIPNDVDYYWRVRAYSGQSVGGWTTGSNGALGRKFRKRWYIQPRLLTPTNPYAYVRLPFFSWTPVPGAAYYKLDIDTDINFPSPDTTLTTANTFATLDGYNGGLIDLYWRVTPYDGTGWPGLASGNPDPVYRYTSAYTMDAPDLVYPFYYYPPDSYNGFSGVTTNPHEDRTVPLPMFIWHRLDFPALDTNAGKELGSAYRLQVSTDPIYETVNWTIDTENTMAVPTSTNPFVPLPNTTYYWRVSALDNIVDHNEIGHWSQSWATRIDLTKGLTPTATGAAPTVLRPTDGYEYTDTNPLLEWFPVSGATSYNVEISQDQNFGSTVDTATVPYPMYISTTSLAQRSLGAKDFGVYYWRVRKATPTVGTWSDVKRFQIAAQSEWKVARSLEDSANRLQIGSDPEGDTSNANYDLTDLYAAESADKWYFGFHIPNSPTQNVTYALYIDLDHNAGPDENTGATFDAYNPAYNMSTIESYRPEYAIYIKQEGDQFAGNKIYIYHWLTNHWETVKLLKDPTFGVGGDFSRVGDYLELEIPSEAIGHQENTGSYAITLVSLPPGGSGTPQDSVPSDPNVPGGGAISRFANVTERMNILWPPNTRGSDPTTYSSFQPFSWDPPVNSPWSGGTLKLYLDEKFTSPAETYISTTTNASNYGHIFHAWGRDVVGDNTYFWRVQPLYYKGNNSHAGGIASQSSKMVRVGFVPKNLKTSVTFATPTFSWDMVEGAESYTLQVATSTEFNINSIVIDVTTTQPSFTSINTLPGNTYYWRVRVNRNAPGGQTILNSWTDPAEQFTLQLPTPDGFTPAAGTIVSKMPALCWNPVIKNGTDGKPVFSAFGYAVQLSTDPSFSGNTIVDGVVTEQNCWTPQNGYIDRDYYWRVATIDGKGIYGPYSAAQTFTKQYPSTALITPTDGSTAKTMPTFVWTPIIGAAYYRLEVSEVITFAPLTDLALTVNARYTPTFNYPTGKTYYWRVAMIDYTGKPGPYTKATIILNPPTSTFSSVAKHDGWVLESSETSNNGGSMNSTTNTINIGDDATKKQYRIILSFSTGALPDNAVITAITLKVKKHSFVGGSDLVNTFQGFLADAKNGFFGTSSSLEKVDFKADATKNCGPFKPSLISDKYNINLICAKDAINKLSTNNGLTQIRLRFKLDDNNNSTANFIKLYSSDATSTADRPQLVITYHLP